MECSVSFNLRVALYQKHQAVEEKSVEECNSSRHLVGQDDSTLKYRHTEYQPS